MSACQSTLKSLRAAVLGVHKMPVSLHLVPVSHLNPTMFQIVPLSKQLQRAMHSAYALAKDLLADRGEATVCWTTLVGTAPLSLPKGIPAV